MFVIIILLAQSQLWFNLSHLHHVTVILTDAAPQVLIEMNDGKM